MKEQRKITIPLSIKLLASMLLLLAIFMLAMKLGAAHTSWRDVRLSFTSSKESSAMILKEIRMPREIGALAVGAALAVSGAIMQGMTRNPLADPGLLGLTAGANAALAITLALLPGVNYFGIMIACFIGSAAGALLVFGIASAKRGGFAPIRLVLAGAAISTFLFAIAEGVGLYFKISKNVSMWTAGGVIGTTWGQLQIIVPVILAGIFIAVLLSRQLTLLSLNEEVAIGLGQNTFKVKAILFVVIILLAGSAVALVGNLAFVGLMIPHIVRAIVGTDYRFIIPVSAVIGGSFMLLADILGRTLQAPFETPVAALIAVIGLPFFLVIVRKGGRAFS
ncbi:MULTISPECIES: iron ABC transporter permease [unclassified Sporosarcina]|uniref:FecCD family ABC transporter permease n=1 Tax=unclassified Sporosarcina TaxID=2647733 RepID=UPI00203FA400|nr:MULTISPECIES: iron ABC transporter permease [unclassified Sporosarcina]GKV64001.1 ferrichrome ABC transporter permease [Sporosarcina sp. NCCP-2331]GLB54782.1 ferrichrome ABC transporter permease [Sporosarcina sp. NCCP-2378]